MHYTTKHKNSAKRTAAAFLSAVILLLTPGSPLVGSAAADPVTSYPFVESFDSVSALLGNGWVQRNNSSPTGTTVWFQGNTTVFNAYSGATNSYIAANWNNVAGNNTISNWLLTPELVLVDGAEFSFYTRGPNAGVADRLEVRLSKGGSSVSLGASSTSVGVFSELLLTINPSLEPAGYPGDWTKYTVTVSGLGDGVIGSGRFAFRYFVPNGGPDGTNGDYIGIDNVEYVVAGEPLLSPVSKTFAEGTYGYSAVSAQAFSVMNYTGTTATDVTAALDSGEYFEITAQLPSSTVNAGSTASVSVRPIADLPYREAAYTDTLRITGTGWTPEAIPLSFSVSKADGVFTAHDEIEVTYSPGLTLAGLSLEPDYAWDAPTTTLSAGAGQSFAATYLDPSGNYESASGEVTVSVNKADGTFPPHAAFTATYSPGLTLAGLSLEPDYAWDAPTTTLNAGAGQSFAATYLDPSDNYEAASGEVTVSVSKAVGTFLPHAAIDVAYSQVLTLAGLPLESGYAWVAPTTVLSAGAGQSFAATYTIPGGNYETALGNIIVNIAPGPTPPPGTPGNPAVPKPGQSATTSGSSWIYSPSSWGTWTAPDTDTTAAGAADTKLLETEDADVQKTPLEEDEQFSDKETRGAAGANEGLGSEKYILAIVIGSVLVLTAATLLVLRYRRRKV